MISKLLFFVLISIIVSYSYCMDIEPIGRESNKRNPLTISPTKDNVRTNDLNRELIVTAVYRSPSLKMDIPIPLARIVWTIRGSGYQTSRGSSYLDEKGELNTRISLKRTFAGNIKRITKISKSVDLTITFDIYMENEYIKVVVSNVLDSALVKALDRKSPYKYTIANGFNLKSGSTKIISNLVFTGVAHKKGIAFPNHYLIAYAIMSNSMINLQASGNGLVEMQKLYVVIDTPDSEKLGNPPILTGYRSKLNILGFSFLDSVVLVTLLHEFGHHIFNSLLRAGNSQYDAPFGSHILYKETSEEMAWSEGYADAFALIMARELQFQSSLVSANGKYSYIFVNDDTHIAGHDIEYYASEVKNILADEGRVAAILYDLYDEEEDSLDIVKPKIEDLKAGYIRDDKVEFKLEWFGNEHVSDRNAAVRFNHIDLLINFLRKSKATTLKMYIESLLKDVADDAKSLTCESLQYNFYPIPNSCQSIPL